MYEETNDFDHILYQFSCKNGGYFLGNKDEGYEPHCMTVLDADTVPVVVAPVTLSGGRYGCNICCEVRCQAEFERPFHMEILPKNLFRSGLEMIEKEGIEIRNLSDSHIVKGDAPELMKLCLPGSEAVRLLAGEKKASVRVAPNGKDDRRHTLAVRGEWSVSGSGVFNRQITEADMGRLVDICRSLRHALAMYPMEPLDAEKDS